MSRRNGILRKVARVVELVNHVICSCSVSIDAEIGERTVFFHRGIGCVVHPNAKIGSDCKIFQGVTLEANGLMQHVREMLRTLAIML